MHGETASKENELEYRESILMEACQGLTTETRLNIQTLSWIINVHIPYLWFTWLTKGRS
jgi:hypothetical protein